MQNLIQTLQTLAPSVDAADLEAMIRKAQRRSTLAPLTPIQASAVDHLDGTRLAIAWRDLASLQDAAQAVGNVFRGLETYAPEWNYVGAGQDRQALRQAAVKFLQAALAQANAALVAGAGGGSWSAALAQETLAEAVQERLQAEQAADLAAILAERQERQAARIERLENATGATLPLELHESLLDACSDRDAYVTAREALKAAGRRLVDQDQDLAPEVADLAAEIRLQARLVDVPALWDAKAVHELAHILEAGADGPAAGVDLALLDQGYHWSRQEVPAQVLERGLAERLAVQAAYLADASGLFWQEEEAGEAAMAALAIFAGNLQASLEHQAGLDDARQHARQQDLKDLTAQAIARDLADGAEQAALDAAAAGTWCVDAACWGQPNVLTRANYLTALLDLAARQHGDEAAPGQAEPEALQAAEKAVQAIETQDDEEAARGALERLTGYLTWTATCTWSGITLELDLDAMAAWSLAYLADQPQRVRTEDLADLAEEAAGMFAGLGEALDAEGYPVLDEDLMYRLEQADETAAWSDVDLDRSLQAGLEERWTEDLTEHLVDAWQALEGDWRQGLAADLADLADLEPVQAEHSNDGCWLPGADEVLEPLATEAGLATALETIERRVYWHDRLAQGDERGEPLEAADLLTLQEAALAIREALGRYLTDQTSPALPFA